MSSPFGSGDQAWAATKATTRSAIIDDRVTVTKTMALPKERGAFGAGSKVERIIPVLYSPVTKARPARR